VPAERYDLPDVAWMAVASGKRTEGQALRTSLRVTTRPARKPVTVKQAKLHRRIDSNADRIAARLDTPDRQQAASALLCLAAFWS
jgi:hypothetical protein